MLVGYPPFYSDDPVTTCRKVWLLFSFVWFLLFQLNHDIWLAFNVMQIYFDIMRDTLHYHIIFILVSMCVMLCYNMHCFFNLTSTCWFQEKKWNLVSAMLHDMHSIIISSFSLVSLWCCVIIYTWILHMHHFFFFNSSTKEWNLVFPIEVLWTQLELTKIKSPFFSGNF